MKNILFLKGKFQEKIWGGDRLRTSYGFDIPSNKTGEYWAVSDMGNMDSIILNSEYKGEQLGEVYRKDRELFGNPKSRSFPLLVKIIDASDDLSIQVHPGDEMAARLENARGKTECWYILNEDKASIIYGLKVDSKDKAIELIDDRRWEDLLKEVPTKKGDFFLVKAGTVHAIKKGSLILEIQQASDITYRLYDYDRINKNGNLRELHIEKSKEAIKILDNKEEIKEEVGENLKTRLLTNNEYFEVIEKSIRSECTFTKNHPYSIFAVVDGEGSIRICDDSYELKEADFFILTNEVKSYSVKGNLTLVEAISKE